MTASFVVANVGAGAYSVAVVASPGGDYASATLTITTSTPTIILSPSSASVGSVVYVSGSGFSTLDTSCSLTGGPFTGYVCAISGGSLTATFVISTTGTGSYFVTATGSPSGDYASAAFQLTATSPAITINPNSTKVGTTVFVSGSGFSSSDSSCTLSGSPVNHGMLHLGRHLTASFVVASASAGTYTVTASGSPGGDYATANFQLVASTPSITLSPTSAQADVSVQVSGRVSISPTRPAQ